MTESTELSPDVMQAIEAGRKIDAIKLLRAERGIDLKAAKDIIDDAVVIYRNANPDSVGRASSGKLSSIIAVIVLAAILYFVFK